MLASKNGHSPSKEIALMAKQYADALMESYELSSEEKALFETVRLFVLISPKFYIFLCKPYKPVFNFR
jgi:hypothetical protein